ncbi:hypothetical protein U1738_05510 [Sphingomonas sp. GB1N7]
MHTAFDVKESMFRIATGSTYTTRDEVIDWEPRDRLGVLIDRHVGALGAGLLTLLVTTAFYDCRSRRRRQRPLYPDIFLFHIGGPWGCFINFDFFPDHKEIMVHPDPAKILREVNNRGITHLVIPDRPRSLANHRFKEPEAAFDRIKQCFIYGVDGEVAGADLHISSTDMKILDSYDGVLELDRLMEDFGDAPNPIPLRLRSASPAENAMTFDYVRRRIPELRKDQPDHLRARRRVDEAREEGLIHESYRRATIDEALEMLG